LRKLISFNKTHLRIFSITFLILIAWFLLFPEKIHSQQEQQHDLFIPDTSVIILAKKFDSIYFPLFLQSLKDIEENNPRLIKEFFNFPVPHNKRLTHIPTFEKIEFGVIPVYDENISNATKYFISFPLLWNNTSNKDYTWQLYFQSLRWIKKYINAERMDSVLLGFKVLNDWIINHTTYPNDQERYAFGDHASAIRMEVIQDAYKKYKSLTIIQPEFENRILLSLLGHIFFIGSLEKYSSYHNHGVILDQSLIKIIKNMPEFNQGDAFIDLAFKRMFEIFRFSFTNEGIHKEHSPCYHAMMVHKLNQGIKLAKKLNISVPHEITDIRQKAVQYLSDINVNGFYPAMGDCYRLQKTLKGKKNRETIKEKFFTIYPNTGWAFILNKEKEINVIAQSDFFSFSHYHEDETSFILNVKGHEMIIDPGLYTYTRSSDYFSYMKSSKAHNVMLVDNKNFNSNIHNTGFSCITRFFLDNPEKHGKNGIIEMTHPHYQKYNVSIYRQLAFLEDGQMLVRDIAESPHLHLYSQLFHLAPGALVSKKNGRYTIRWENHPYFLIITSNEDSFEVLEGESVPMQGWISPKFGEVAEAPVLVLNKVGENCDFLTQIEIKDFGVNEKRSTGSKKKFNRLIKNLEYIERRELYHTPFPEKWIPERKK